MAKTLLDAINSLLKRVGQIAGDAGTLTSLTDSPRQKHIDRGVQMFNEAVITLYDLSNEPFPNELGEGSITLVSGTRAYQPPTDKVRLRWPLHDRTNGRYILEYKGGYEQMMKDQPFPSNHTGLPTHAVIRPTDGYLYLDKIPTANENGYIYTVLYDKSLILENATDTFPFADEVVTMLIPAVAEVWQRWTHKDFERKQFERALAGAARLMSQGQKSDHWTPFRGCGGNLTDPFNG